MLKLDQVKPQCGKIQPNHVKAGSSQTTMWKNPAKPCYSCSIIVLQNHMYSSIKLNHYVIESSEKPWFRWIKLNHYLAESRGEKKRKKKVAEDHVQSMVRRCTTIFILFSAFTLIIVPLIYQHHHKYWSPCIMSAQLLSGQFLRKAKENNNKKAPTTASAAACWLWRWWCPTVLTIPT